MRLAEFTSKTEEVEEEAAGVGIITKQNTTADVKPGEITRQANKFNLELDKSGHPAQLKEFIALPAVFFLATNAFLIARVISFAAIIAKVATYAWIAVRVFKTLRWIFRKVGIMNEPEEVVQQANDDPGYMKRLSHKIADYFKSNKDEAEQATREIKLSLSSYKQVKAQA